MMLYALSFVLCGGVAALRGPTQHAERSRILADAWWQSADLPSGPNKAPPAGYKPIAGSGKCMCRGGGNGLDSCGTLCCDASPYTDPDPSGQYYVGTRGGMCYEPCDGSEGGFDQWWKDPCLGLPYGPNNAAPAGYKAIAGAGTCNCRGSGNGLDSCGTLCCAASPYTDPDPSGTYYAGKSATVRVDWHGDGACGTPGTNLGKAFTSVQECGEAAAQRDPSCKRIQWSEDYNNLWGCSCCVDGGGTDGDGNIYYKVYEITSNVKAQGGMCYEPETTPAPLGKPTTTPTPKPTSAPTPAPIATTGKPTSQLTSAPTPAPIATTGKQTGMESLFSGDLTILSNGDHGAFWVAINSAGDLMTWSTPGSLIVKGGLGLGACVSDLELIAVDVDKVFIAGGSFAAIGADTSVGSWARGPYARLYAGDSSSVASELTSGIVDIFSTDYAFAALTDNGGLVTWGDASRGGDSSSVFQCPAVANVQKSTLSSFFRCCRPAHVGRRQSLFEPHRFRRSQGQRPSRDVGRQWRHCSERRRSPPHLRCGQSLPAPALGLCCLEAGRVPAHLGLLRKPGGLQRFERRLFRALRRRRRHVHQRGRCLLCAQA